jgi:hypothetical protein
MLFGSTVCSLKGEHKCDEWIYSASQAHCLGQSTCARCGAVQQKEDEHQWNDWSLPNPKTCQQTRACRRCGQLDETTQYGHLWRPWEAQRPKECYRTRSCQRCGLSERSEPRHAWVEKQTRRFPCDDSTNVCAVCGATKEIKGEHDFSATATRYDTDGSVLGWYVECYYCHDKEYQVNEQHPKYWPRRA